MNPKAKRVPMPRIPSFFILCLGVLGSCGFLESPVSTQAIFKFPTSSSQSRPLANWACLNVWGPDGRWNSSVKAMARVDRDYKVTFTVPYLWVGRKYTFRILGFDTSPSNDSNYTCPTASSSTDFTELGILENQLITKDTTQVLITAHSILFDSKVCGTVGKSCYSNIFTGDPSGVKLQDGTAIEYVPTIPSDPSSFHVWREQGGNLRLLKATGLWASSNDWQKKLNRRGDNFTTEPFSQPDKISGRVCPPTTFITYSEMTRQNHCIYYYNTTDTGSLDQGSQLTEAEDYLSSWNRPLTGNNTNASFYEGNVLACNNLGMRLPALYEMCITTPPTTTPDDATPSPQYTATPQKCVETQTEVWTATAFNSNSKTDHFFTVSAPDSIKTTISSNATPTFYCVLP